MSRALDDLHQAFKPRAIELLARLTEAEIPCLIVDTLRTPAEHQENLARGVSWIAKSKHLFGLAIDVAPYEIYQAGGQKKVNWNAGDPVWQRIGAIGEKLGLVWGGRWTKKDMGHFELPGGLIPTDINA